MLGSVRLVRVEVLLAVIPESVLIRFILQTVRVSTNTDFINAVVLGVRVSLAPCSSEGFVLNELLLVKLLSVCLLHPLPLKAVSIVRVVTTYPLRSEILISEWLLVIKSDVWYWALYFFRLKNRQQIFSIADSLIFLDHFFKWLTLGLLICTRFPLNLDLIVLTDLSVQTLELQLFDLALRFVGVEPVHAGYCLDSFACLDNAIRRGQIIIEVWAFRLYAVYNVFLKI